ncbi:MAG: enterobactin transporter EntS, partial [Chloroflexi bacterium]|nr:enterobactin transporter EntS [Chloroflexota bacterium]
MLPQLVRLELGGGVEVLGALQSATALGMVAGALAIGQWGKGFPRGAGFYGALALSGLALAGLGLVPNLPAALTLAAGLGASAGAANV